MGEGVEEVPDEEEPVFGWRAGLGEEAEGDDVGGYEKGKG